MRCPIPCATDDTDTNQTQIIKLYICFHQYFVQYMVLGQTCELWTTTCIIQIMKGDDGYWLG